MNSAERPTAYLGILYDRLARRYDNPLEMIQKAAESGRQHYLDNTKPELQIDPNLSDIIHRMIGLPVQDRFNPTTLDGLQKMNILRLERLAYIRLTRLLKKELPRPTNREFQDIGLEWRVGSESLRINYTEKPLEIGGVEYYSERQAAQRLGLYLPNIRYHLAQLYKRSLLSPMQYGTTRLVPAKKIERMHKKIKKHIGGWPTLEREFENNMLVAGQVIWALGRL